MFLCLVYHRSKHIHRGTYSGPVTVHAQKYVVSCRITPRNGWGLSAYAAGKEWIKTIHRLSEASQKALLV